MSKWTLLKSTSGATLALASASIVLYFVVVVRRMAVMIFIIYYLVVSYPSVKSPIYSYIHVVANLRFVLCAISCCVVV